MVDKSPYEFPFYDLAMITKFPYMVRFLENKFSKESILFSSHGSKRMKQCILPYMTRFIVCKLPYMFVLWLVVSIYGPFYC